MELKLEVTDRAFRKVRVLIEPLWNWNGMKNETDATKPGLNRTFMELKPEKGGTQLVVYHSLNRTFMELKLYKGGFVEPYVACLNRTFMELKQEEWKWSLFLGIVLIEPLWNWNLLFAYRIAA